MKAYGNPESLRRAPEQVLFEKSPNGIARITLNRPEKHNAMTVPMRARIMELVHQCEEDAAVAGSVAKVVSLRGTSCNSKHTRNLLCCYLIDHSQPSKEAVP